MSVPPLMPPVSLALAVPIYLPPHALLAAHPQLPAPGVRSLSRAAHLVAAYSPVRAGQQPLYHRRPPPAARQLELGQPGTASAAAPARRCAPAVGSASPPVHNPIQRHISMPAGRSTAGARQHSISPQQKARGPNKLGPRTLFCLLSHQRAAVSAGGASPGRRSVVRMG